MKSDEKIGAVLGIIKNKIDLNPEVKRLAIFYDNFSEMEDDVDTILQGLEKKKAITVMRQPLFDDTEYAIHVGLIDDKQLRFLASYIIDIRSDFNKVYEQYLDANEIDESDIETTVILNNNEVILLAGSDKITLKRIRTDLLPHRLLTYLFEHENIRNSKANILHAISQDLPHEPNLTELIRQLGFDRTLKSYFFPELSSERVVFKKTAKVPKNVIETYRKSP